MEVEEMEESEKCRIKSNNLCQVCKLNPFKYTCPGCGVRTCCLDCIRIHKKEKKCSGVKSWSKIESINKYNDKTLSNDYFFLSEVARRIDSSVRGINEFPAWNSPHMVENINERKHSLPNYLSLLLKQAEQRKVDLVFLPRGMTKQKENKTRYLNREGIITWYTEWVLTSITPPITFYSKISELETIGEAFKRELNKQDTHLYPLLSKYQTTEIEGLVILLEKTIISNEIGQTSVRMFYVVPANLSLRNVLSGTRVIEYPTFHVIMPNELTKYTICNLPLLPLDPWKAPEKKVPITKRNIEEEASPIKHVKLNESTL